MLYLKDVKTKALERFSNLPEFMQPMTGGGEIQTDWPRAFILLSHWCTVGGQWAESLSLLATKAVFCSHPNVAFLQW